MFAQDIVNEESAVMFAQSIAMVIGSEKFNKVENSVSVGVFGIVRMPNKNSM